MSPLLKPLFGIYIHWPYCLSKCPYCDFYSKPCPQPDYKKILKTYQRDILFFKNIIPDAPPAGSIFFGGGTPSLMPIELLRDLLNFLKKHFPISDSAEITMEANPDAVDLEKMRAFKQLGINRLSLGVQALEPKALQLLGRRHTVETAKKRLKEAKSIFDEINADFIYARPHQTLLEWTEELKHILDLNLTHYSLYQLTIEENTPFAKQNIQVPDEETAAVFYQTTNQLMRQSGFPPYEISNYATDEHMCHHNLTYWRGGDYLGIGPAAHGRIGLKATSQINSVLKWISTPPQVETLTQQERTEEKIIMGLRLMREGFPTALLNQNGLKIALKNGWGEIKNAYFYPSEKGFLILNQLIFLLIPDK